MLNKIKPLESLVIVALAAFVVVLSAGQTWAHAGHSHPELRSENLRASIHQAAALSADQSLANGHDFERLVRQSISLVARVYKPIAPPMSTGKIIGSVISGIVAQSEFILSSVSVTPLNSCNGNCCNCPSGCCTSHGCGPSCGSSATGCSSAGTALNSAQSVALRPPLSNSWPALLDADNRSLSVAPALPPPRA